MVNLRTTFPIYTYTLSVVHLIIIFRLPFAGLADPPKPPQRVVLLNLDMERIMSLLGDFGCSGHAEAIFSRSKADIDGSYVLDDLRIIWRRLDRDTASCV